MNNIIRIGLMLFTVVAVVFTGEGAVLAATPPGELEVKGVISAVDKTASPATVTITTKEGLAITLKVGASTSITRAGVGKATIDDLAKDDRAEASYNKDTLVASRIAASPPLAKHHPFVGTISSVSSAVPSSFVMATKTQPSVTIVVNAQTKFKVPGLKTATLVDFKVGNKVAVLAVEAAGGFLALNVNLIPGKPLSVQREGTVQDYQPGKSITVKGRKGEASTFVVNADTKIRLKRGDTEIKVDDRVHVIARRDPASDQYIAREILVFGANGSQKPEERGKPEKPDGKSGKDK